MRALLSAVLCLSMAVCIMADFEMGERLPDDQLVKKETISMSRRLVIPLKVTLEVSVPSHKVLTYVKISNIGGSTCSYDVQKSSSNTMIVKVTGERGKRMNIEMVAYAIELNKITTSAPTTTSISSTMPAEATTIEETATPEEIATTNEAATTEEAMTTGEAMTTEEAPMTEEVPTTEEALMTEEVPTTEEAPMTEEPSVTEEAPITEEAEITE